MLHKPKGKELILLIHRYSIKIIKETSHKIFTGLGQGTVMTG
jgi:hypothetical protein